MIKEKGKREFFGKLLVRPAVVFISVLLFQLILIADKAESLPGQTYLGDGATINATVPPGGWLYTQTAFYCLGCHNPNANASFRGPDMTSYLKTGHKNMMRSTQEIPTSLTGPDGYPYGGDLFGNTLGWIDNTVTVAGFCTNLSYADQASCSSGGGVWISGIKPLYYVLGGWMGDHPLPMSLFDGSYTQGTQKTAVAYSCGRCHTTGFTLDTTVRIRGRNPEATFPFITWTPSRPGAINFDPDGNGPAIASSWELDGIQCERCHDATNHAITGKATVSRGTNATVLCLNCHRQDHTMSYTGGGIGSNIFPTPYADNASLPVSEPLYSLPAIEVGGSDGYALEFYSYSIGMEFLNGVHAKFTGSFQQIGDPARYQSVFVSEGATGGGPGNGCTTCHDVHQSTAQAVNAAPFKQSCPDCHAVKAAYLMSNIRHPFGTGTPLGDGSNIAEACIICHMPHTNQGSGPAMHLFRINASPSYSTFPTQSQWIAGQKTANTAPDGTYSDAVWADVDLACGQCHVGDGGSGYTSPRNGAPLITKTFLAAYAGNIHNDNPIVGFGYTLDPLNTLKVNVDATQSLCLSSSPCDVYSWDWGDGGTTANYGIATATHTYAAAGTYHVTLTVTDYGTSNSGTISQNITVYVPDYPPSASSIFSFNANTSTATLTDTSTDDHGVTQVTVNWGDGGAISVGVQGGIFSHTYLTSGSYTITHKAIDTAGQVGSETIPVSVTVVPVTYSISGTVTKNDGVTALSNVTLIFRNTTTGAQKVVYSASNGTFSATSLKAGTYTVAVAKAGYTFPSVPNQTITTSSISGLLIKAN